jgi:3-oxoadipate enol-lactonase
MPYLDRGDARIFWDDEGDGDAVLLIMGLGYTSDMWYRVLPALSKRHRVLYFDNRGVGRTGVPPGPYSIETMAADAAAVVEASGEATAHVVGISLGGVIAQELALSRPEVTRSLVLISTHTGGEQSVLPEPEALSMIVDRSSMTPREAARVAVPFVYAAETDRALVDEDIDRRMRRPTSRVGYDNQLRGSIAYAGSHSRLPSLRVPTLVVHGTADRLVPPANAQVLADAIPNARVAMIEGAGHIILTDACDEVTGSLLGFFDSVGTSDRDFRAQSSG